MLHIPVALCAVVPIYHLKELEGKPPLKLTGAVLADIFLGKISQWNDPALKALNEGVKLPDTKITVVHRKDSSGTTFLFAKYLGEVSPEWLKKIGPAKNDIKWPVGVEAYRNQGVAAEVWQTDGAIGYVDRIFAKYPGVEHAALQNRDQTAFIHADAPNMTAALKGMASELPEDLTFSLTNRPGKDSYPISGGIWAVCYESQPAADGKMVKEFLQWATHDGQTYVTEMTYAPLPEELIERVDKQLKLIKTGR
jgi:phosphate transport system substrate-binding protein